MKNNILDVEGKINSCTSCQLCYAVCPTKAISISLDNEGFYRPVVNEDNCISCGLCKEFCYKFDNNIKLSDMNQGTYAAKSKNKKVLKNSTSGGVGTHLAEILLMEGYKIIGVTYNYKTNRAENIVIDKVEDVYKIQGSKYIQSYSAEVFKKLINDLPNHKYAIFGLPCQIYALDRYLNKINRRNEFILIDLFCHGCPSMTLWDKYLQDITDKNGLSELNKVEFRSKIKGWHEFIVTVEDKNGKKFVSKNEQDPFFRLFFSNKLLNQSCYDCKLRSTLRYADIRIGDYWGAKYDLDTEGVSAVVLISKKAKMILKKLINNCYLEEEELSNIVKCQSYGKDYPFNVNEREQILDLFNQYKNLDEVMINYSNLLSSKEKLKFELKSVYLSFPKKLRYFLRKIHHNKK